MQHLLAKFSVLVLSVTVLALSPAAQAAVTPIHITALNAVQDTEKYVINVKITKAGAITKNTCKFASTVPKDKSKLVCASVTSVAMATDPEPDAPGVWASFSGMMDIYDTSGVLNGTEPYTVYVQDNATPGDNADKLLLHLGSSSGLITLTSGDFIIQ